MHRREPLLHAADVHPGHPGRIRLEAALHAEKGRLAEPNRYRADVDHGMAADQLLAGVQYDLTAKIIGIHGKN